MTTFIRILGYTTAILVPLTLTSPAWAGPLDRFFRSANAAEATPTAERSGNGSGRVVMSFGARDESNTVNPDWAALVGTRLDLMIAPLAAEPVSRERLVVVLREVIANVRTTAAATRERLGASLRYSLMAHARTEGLMVSPLYSFDMRSGTVTLLDADAGETVATIVDGYALIDRIAEATGCDETACVDRVLAGDIALSGPA
jgi:hypothetical protein